MKGEPAIELYSLKTENGLCGMGKSSDAWKLDRHSKRNILFKRNCYILIFQPSVR
jgi:hypothetical protein